MKKIKKLKIEYVLTFLILTFSIFFLSQNVVYATDNITIEDETLTENVERPEATGSFFTWFIIVIAFLKVNQKLNGILSSLGINAVSNGGSLMGEVMQVARMAGHGSKGFSENTTGSSGKGGGSGVENTKNMGFSNLAGAVGTQEDLNKKSGFDSGASLSQGMDNSSQTNSKGDNFNPVLDDKVGTKPEEPEIDLSDIDPSDLELNTFEPSSDFDNISYDGFEDIDSGNLDMDTSGYANDFEDIPYDDSISNEGNLSDIDTSDLGLNTFEPTNDFEDIPYEDFQDIDSENLDFDTLNPADNFDNEEYGFSDIDPKDLGLNTFEPSSDFENIPYNDFQDTSFDNQDVDTIGAGAENNFDNMDYGYSDAVSNDSNLKISETPGNFDNKSFGESIDNGNSSQTNQKDSPKIDSNNLGLENGSFSSNPSNVDTLDKSPVQNEKSFSGSIASPTVGTNENNYGGTPSHGANPSSQLENSTGGINLESANSSSQLQNNAEESISSGNAPQVSIGDYILDSGNVPSYEDSAVSQINGAGSSMLDSPDKEITQSEGNTGSNSSLENSNLNSSGYENGSLQVPESSDNTPLSSSEFDNSVSTQSGIGDNGESLSSLSDNNIPLEEVNNQNSQDFSTGNENLNANNFKSGIYNVRASENIITGLERNQENPDGIKFALYSTENYNKPESECEIVKTKDNKTWYKQYAQSVEENVPKIDSKTGNITYERKVVKRLPPKPQPKKSNQELGSKKGN